MLLSSPFDGVTQGDGVSIPDSVRCSHSREGAVCSKSSRRWLASPYRSDALVVDWEHVVVSRGVFARMGSWPDLWVEKAQRSSWFCKCSLPVAETSGIVFRTRTGCSRLCSNQGGGRHNARWQGHRAKRETLSCKATVIFVLLVYTSLQGSFRGFRRLPSSLRWHFSRQVHDLPFVRNFLPWSADLVAMYGWPGWRLHFVEHRWAPLATAHEPLWR